MAAERKISAYGVAIASTAIALLLSLSLSSLIDRTIGAFFYVAIALTSWYGGWRPGLVATGLSTLAINFYWLRLQHPDGTHLDDVFRLLLFISVALILTGLSNNLRVSRQKIERLSQDATAETENRLQTALNAAQMGMWDWDLVTGVINWSPEHEQLLGLAPGTFDGCYRTFEACLHPADRAGIEQAVTVALQQHVPYWHEFRVIWPDGSEHWIEGRGRGVYDEAGQAVRMTGTIMAIDERKHAQLLLQQQLEQQQLILEITNRIRRSPNLSDILQTTVDEVRQFLQVDRVLIFQFTPDWGGTVQVESVGDPAWAILSRQLYDPCIGLTYVGPFQEGLVTAKADILTTEISDCHREFLTQLQVRANLVVPILKDNQLWGLLVAHHCVAPRPWQETEVDLLRQLAAQVSIALQQAALFAQLHAELVERKQAELALQQSEARLRLAQVASNSAVWDWDVQTNQVFWSPEYYQLYQLAPTLTPTYENWLHAIHPEDRERTHQATLQALAQHASEVRIEFRRVRSEDVRWFADIGQIFWNEAGEATRIIGITIDITAQKQTELALQALTTELEQRVLERTIALQQSSNLLQRFFDASSSAQIGLCIQDRDLRFVQINEALAAINGYPVAAHLGKTSTELMPGLAPMINPLLQQVLTTGQPILNLELTAPAPSQPEQVRSWLASYFPIGQLQEPDAIAGVGVILIDISDRKRAETALQQSMHEVEDLYNHAPCGYHSLDAAGHIIQINDTELMWLGYDRAEVLNHSILEFLTPASQQVMRTTFPQFKALGWIENLELEVISKDGTTRWINLNATAITDAAGQFLMSRSSLFDVSDRRRAELLILQQTRQKQLLWTITQAMRQSLDLKVILNTAVAAIRPLLNLDRVAIYQFDANWSGDFIVESVAAGWGALVEPATPKVWEDTYLQETQGGRFKAHETLVVADIYQADLQPCHVELLEQFQARAYAIAPIFLGESLWGLLALYHNAAPRDWQGWEIELLQQIASQLAIAIQQAELYSQLQIELQERQQTAAVLSEAERRWRSLLDNVQLLVVGLDQAGCINYVNPFFLTLTGFTPAEVVGQDWMTTFVPASRQQEGQQVFAEVIHQHAHPYYQDAILTKTGEARLIAWNNTGLQDVDGTAIGTISIGQDITERQKVEKLKDEFIGIVSHELRTPLTAIQMSLGLVQSGVYAKKPEKAQRMIEIALADTHRLVNLVNDILDLERLESGRWILERAICGAMELMQAAVNGVQAIAQQHSIHLEIVPTQVQVWAAADSILQTLTNLLSNAIKFSPPHSTVVLEATPQLESALFQVRDQGRGIPEDKLELIFGRFQQVDASDSREKGGTGLGLPICRSIIERHGGKIWAESTVSSGSTFCFTLPLAILE